MYASSATSHIPKVNVGRSNRLTRFDAVRRTDSHNLAPLRGLSFYWGLYFFHALRKRSHRFSRFRAWFWDSFRNSHPCQLHGILALVFWALILALKVDSPPHLDHMRTLNRYVECAVFQIDA